MDWLMNSHRQVHLDFHTPGFLDNVGELFDAEKFAETMAEAHVDTVVAFAKCHYGMAYYDTKLGRRNPSLTFDMLRQMIDALHRRNIKVFGYYSVGVDHTIGQEHPEWMMVDDKGVSLGGRGDPVALLWNWICFNSPYVPTKVWPEIEEIVSRYDIDGLWMDMTFYPEGTCYCEYCRGGMSDAGKDPSDPSEHREFCHQAVLNFLEQTTTRVRALKPECKIVYNNMIKIGSRCYLPYLDLFEIEAVPLGWGYLHSSVYMRHLRTLGKPFKGITARFHKTFSDFGSIRNTEQMKYEFSAMVANGGGCIIVDQMEPSGTLPRPAYETIGEAFGFIEKRQALASGARSVPYVAVLAQEEPGSLGRPHARDDVWGAALALIESHYHFDVIDQPADFGNYTLIIVPGVSDLRAETVQRLKEYVSAGGALLVAGEAGLTGDGQGPEAGPSALEEILGLRCHGTWPFEVGYVRVLDEGLKLGLPEMDLVLHRPFFHVEPSGDTVALAGLVHPLIPRRKEKFVSHCQAPPRQIVEGVAVTLRRFGQGYACCIAAPFFDNYYADHDPTHRHLLSNLIGLLIPPDKRLLEVNAPPSVEVNLMEKEESLQVHMVCYHAERRGSSVEVVEWSPPVENVEITVKVDGPVKRAFLASGDQGLTWSQEGNFVRARLRRLELYDILIIEQK